METANAAGAVPVGVTWGFRSVSELKEHGARYLVNNAAELKDLILNYR